MSLPTMHFSKLFSVLFALSALCLSQAVFAGKPEIYTHKRKGAVKGADVVAYFDLKPGDKAVMGDDAYTHEYKGSTFKFANKVNLERFKANPERYVPQYGGYCSFAVSKGFTTSVRPDNWRIVDDKLYLNYNAASYKNWEKNLKANIVKGDNNWPKVLNK